MAYSQEISRQHKALFIFLLDQSFSMEEPMANGTNRKADELALALNAWLQNMVVACSKAEGFKEFMDICRQSKRIWGDMFTYTLINEKDFASKPKTKAKPKKVTEPKAEKKKVGRPKKTTSKSNAKK